MVSDKADDALPRLFDVPLGEANEFDVVVVQPGFSLAERLAVRPRVPADFVVAADELRDPGVRVRGEAGEGRIAEDNWNCGLRIADCGLRGKRWLLSCAT